MSTATDHDHFTTVYANDGRELGEFPMIDAQRGCFLIGPEDRPDDTTHPLVQVS